MPLKRILIFQVQTASVLGDLPLLDGDLFDVHVADEMSSAFGGSAFEAKNLGPESPVPVNPSLLGILPITTLRKLSG